MEQVGERLKRERLERGWTVEYMAAIGDVTAQTQRRYESGKRTPDAGYLAILASGCGLDVQYVLTGVRSSNVPSQREIVDAELREQRGEYDGAAPAAALSSFVHGLERASMYVVPDLLESLMEATKSVPDAQRSAVFMKAYSVVYASAPDESALEGVTIQDVQPVVELIVRLQGDAPAKGRN